MKKEYKISIFYSCFFFLFNIMTLFAQSNIKRQENSTKNGTPMLIEFYPSGQTQGASFAPPSTATIMSSSTPSGNVLSTYLSIPAGNTFSQISSNTDGYQITHTKYQQYYNGIKVEGGTYSVHSRNGSVELMNGEFKPVTPNSVTTASITESVALRRAKAAMTDATAFSTTPAAEMVFMDPQMSGKDLKLAYKFRITATQPKVDGYFVYVDAQNGNILFKYPFIHNCFVHQSGSDTKNAPMHAYNKITNISLPPVLGTLVTRYSGSRTGNTDSFNGVYRLRDYSRGNGIETYNAYNAATFTSPDIASYDQNFPVSIDYNDSDNNWQEYNNSQKDNAALDAHLGTQNTYDYFKNVHGRNSIDNNNMVLKSYVNLFGNVLSNFPAGTQAFSNAYWDGSRMVYFCGDGTYYDALVSQDVVSHELGHGVCQFTANLIYDRESGALNESLSDIWGAAVEYYKYGSTKQTWLLGDEFDIVNHTGFRSMSNPKSKNHPNTYRGQYWNWLNQIDYGGVHINSGVINYWFYLLSQGGAGTNDFGVSYNVPSIGITAASAIVYYTESVLLTSSSNFSDFRTLALQATSTIYGATSTQYNSVVEAFKAVGLTNPLLPAQVYNACTAVPPSWLNFQVQTGDGQWAAGNYSVNTCFSNKPNACGFGGTPNAFIALFTPNGNENITYESGGKIALFSQVNRVDGNGVPMSDAYVKLIPSPNGKIALRICSNYIPGARQATPKDEVVSNITDSEVKPLITLNASPNPANETFNVYYKIAESSSVKILLFSSKGKEIAILANEKNQEAGEYLIGYDSLNLEEGLYLVKIIANGNSETTKVYVQR